ncbi:hypothetical protein HPP92_013652 [Vanilla planifolia]|uniref:Premnaspirodiene oxygenase-like n=1 Tax=Vanilla planifolia TaxID=51239 RepID=A0A835QVZ4_VANPL|nr:hypothetical protein HPP92_013652 [Vanilla planifolia]
MAALTFSTVGLIVSVLFALVWMARKFNLTRNRGNKIKLPPGPWKLPIIGNLHHLIGEHPHRRFLSLAKTYGPLLYLKLGEIDLIVITSAELACDVMKTHDIVFASRPELLGSKIISYNSSGIAFSPYGKYWSQLRKICTLNLLSPKRVNSFGVIREEEGSHLVEAIRAANGSPVNLSKMFLSVAYATFARAAFGKECAHRQEFLMAMKETFKLASGFSIVDLFPSLGFLGDVTGLRARLLRLHQVLDEILSEIIEEHEEKAREDSADGDLIDILLGLRRDGELGASTTMDNIKAVILDLFLAGTETTSSTLVWAMTELIRHPKALQKAQTQVRNTLQGKTEIKQSDVSNLPYLKMVIKETLRIRPAAPLLVPRVCSRPVELHGCTIPAGSRVVINAWAIMRDAKYWASPVSFEPERFEANCLDYKGSNFEYIPFGAGRRICPGVTFALSGVEYWLALLLFHFDWQLPEGDGFNGTQVEEVFGLTLNRKIDLCLLATPHK